MIKKAFKKGKIFIPFIMAGHPSIEITIQAIISLIKMGSGLIEIGVPFSDPIADGIQNQRAAEVALKNGVTLDIVLNIVRKIRSQGFCTPIVLFSYFNPILSMGVEKFAYKAKKAGINGVLIVDLPPEEGEEIYHVFRKASLDIVLLVSPTTESIRFDLYNKLDPAFIYYISRCGVTGAQSQLALGLKEEIEHLRRFFPVNQKIVVGFGISTVEQAKQVIQFSDGVVMGSHLVKTLEEKGLTEFERLAGELVKAIITQLSEKGCLLENL